MKCDEVRRSLEAYFDSELDAKTSLEVEHHLGSCAECAGLFEAEKKFSQRISSALRKGERTPALWTAVESSIRPAQRVLSIWRWPLAAGAVVVLLAAIWISHEARPLDLAAAAGECHNAYVQKITSPEFNGPVPEWIARELGNELDVAAFDYRPRAAGFSTDGARFCHVANVPTALILGHYENVPVSLLIFKKSELAHFPRTKARLEAGEPVVCGRAGRYQFAVRIVDDHVICAVAQMSQSTLENLVEAVVRKT
jgi:anti-sigma factor RsiW